MKHLLRFILMLPILFALGTPAASALPAAGALTILQSFVSLPAGSLQMGVHVEIFGRDLVKNLFKNNPFMAYAFNADAYVLGGKVVHIPKSGDKPNVEKNRDQLPAVVKIRTDSDISYVIDQYTTDPILIEDADNYELNYEKRADVLSDHQMALDEVVGDWMLYNWFTYTLNGVTTTGHIIRTTGGATAIEVVATAPGATGDRLKFVKENLQAAQTYMNKNNIPKNERYAAFDSELYAQLVDDEDLKKRDGVMGGETNLKEGVIFKLYGFQIMERASVLTFTNAGTPVAKEPGADTATTDNSAVLCWQKNSVERAKGTTKFFDDEGNPVYYGDIFSALIRVGGRIRRAEGVVAIVQAHPAG